LDVVDVSKVVDYSNIRDWVERYESGVSMKTLSDTLGISRDALTRQFRKRGVRIRGRSEAERLKWESIRRSGRAAVVRQCSSAWEARRGQTVALSTKIQQARTRYIRLNRCRGAYEDEISAALLEMGYSVAQQFPVGPYNLDLAMTPDPVAVEIQSSNHRRSGSSIRQDRIEEILDSGFAVLIVYVPNRASLAVEATCDKIAAFTDLVREEPSIVGQYGMIGSDAQPFTPRRFDLPDRPRIPGF